MPRPSDTLSIAPPSGPEVDGQNNLFEATIETGAAAPPDEVWVLISDLDGEKHRHGPVVWTPTIKDDGIYYPKTAESALVLRAKETGDLWLAQWTPLGEPDAAFESEGGGDKTYEHSQGVASKEWLIEHGLGKVPSVEAFDTTDQQLDFQLVLVDANSIILRFNIDISGKAVLN